MKKRLLGLILVIALVCPLGIPATAETNHAIDNAESYSDVRLEEFLMKFLTTIYDLSQDPSEDDFKPYFTEGNDLVPFTYQKALLKRAMLKYNGDEYISGKFSFSEFQKSLRDGKLVVDLRFREDVETKLGQGGAITGYTITIEPADDFAIVEIVSEDDVDQSYRGVDWFTAERVIERLIEDEKTQYIRDAEAAKLEAEYQAYMQSILDGTGGVQPEALTLYDRSLAVTYAKGWSQSRNDLFPDYTGVGGDCQNFASQSVYVGFGGYLTYPSIANMEYPMVTGLGAKNWYTQTTGNATSSWINCRSFWSLIKDYTSPGLTGWVYEGSLAFAQPGDIVQVQWTSSGSYHAYIVVDVNPNASPYFYTKSDITIVCHTPDRPPTLLSDENTEPVSRHRLIRIGNRVS